MPAILPRLGTALLAASLVAGLPACSRIRDHKGYVADSLLIDAIAPGVDNRDSVAKTLGRPSFVGQFDRGGQSWYYVSRDTRQIAFANPRAVSQMTLAVRFDAAGNVVGVDKSGMERVVAIDPQADKTPTLGRKTGFFSELFGNIGRVGAAGPGGTTADNPDQ